MKSIGIILIIIVSITIGCTNSINAQGKSTSELLSKNQYTFENYTLILSFTVKNSFDMELHVFGSGNLTNKVMSINIGTLLIMANDKIIYVGMHKLNFETNITETQEVDYLTSVNIEANITANYMSLNTINNVSASIDYIITEYYSPGNVNTSSHLLIAEKSILNSIPVNNGSFDTIIVSSSVFIIIGLLITVGYVVVNKKKKTIQTGEKKILTEKEEQQEFIKLTNQKLEEVYDLLKIIDQNKNDLLFAKDFINIQEKGREIIQFFTSYESITDEMKFDLESLEKALFINFHNILYPNLLAFEQNEHQIESNLNDIVEKIRRDNLFSNYTIETFLVDFGNLIADSEGKGKNIVLQKMKTFEAINATEFESFKENLRKIQTQKKEFTYDFMELFNLVTELFSNSNNELLAIIKNYTGTRQKIDRLQEKYRSIRSKVDQLQQILIQLQKNIKIIRENLLINIGKK